MTGPEHYKEAERLLAMDHSYAIEGQGDIRYGNPGPEADEIARAQVHATLALVAATAQLDAYEGPGGGSCTGRSLAEVNGWNAAFDNDRAASR